MVSPQLSVIIVNYNAGPELEKCVKSVAKTNENLEIIIVDNNSKDESLANLSRSYKGDKKLVVIRNENNRGFAVACNQGSNAAEGNFFFYLNPDCIVTPQTIPVLLGYIQKNPGVGMAGGLILNQDGTEQRGCRRAIPTPWKSLVNSFGLHRLAKLNKGLFSDFRLDREALPDEPIEVDAISGACMMVTKEAYRDVGLMDEGYFLHCEDLDWCMRFWQKGWKIMFVPEARLVHNKGTCSATRPVFVEWAKHKGMARFYKKFFRSKYSFPMDLLVLLGIWFRFFLSLGKIFFAKIGMVKNG